MASWIAKLKTMGKSLDSMDDLFVHELEDLYSCENQLIDALPKMEDAASSPELKQAFHQHLETTRRQRDRLDRVFRDIGREPEAETCEGVKGIIAEGEEIMAVDGDRDVKDAALLACAQRVEHYEIAGYGTVRNFAERLGRGDIAQALQQTLDEESAADESLTRLAEAAINRNASRHREPGETGGWEV